VGLATGTDNFKKPKSRSMLCAENCVFSLEGKVTWNQSTAILFSCL